METRAEISTVDSTLKENLENKKLPAIRQQGISRKLMQTSI
jgi:hypothetical protein